MYISKIKLVNFKSFKGEHVIEFSEGVNFFVGNNNCGKTTIFKAIEFIQSGKNKLDFITQGLETENISVELEFKGADLSEIVNDENLNLNKYSDYVIDNEDGTYSLRVLRSSQECEVTQGRKTVSLDISKVRIYNPNSTEEDEIKMFENPTGIDKTITALFDAQFVYSDIKNEDYQDFGKTKIIGKIINDITKDFQKGDIWKEFQDAHKKTFGDEGLGKILEGIATKISSVLKDQYGDGEVQFKAKSLAEFVIEETIKKDHKGLIVFDGNLPKLNPSFPECEAILDDIDKKMKKSRGIEDTEERIFSVQSTLNLLSYLNILEFYEYDSQLQTAINGILSLNGERNKVAHGLSEIDTRLLSRKKLKQLSENLRLLLVECLGIDSSYFNYYDKQNKELIKMLE